MGLDAYKSCKFCKHIFQYQGFGDQICPACRQEDEELFRKVKNYLRDNPGSTIYKTAEDCEVSVERIRYWLKDERLEYSVSGDTGLTCEHCGAPILSGTLCDECRQQLNRAAGELRNSIARPVEENVIRKQDNKNKMRFLNRAI